MPAPTPAELREQAAEVRRYAQYAEGATYHRELARAQALEAEAGRLEVEAPRRRRLYRLMEVGRKALGWDEDTWRAFLADHGAQPVDGRPSRTTLSLAQLDACVADMKRLGFTPKRRQPPKSDWRRPRIDKITAIWITLADAGVVRERSETAMRRWCAKQTGKARLEWCATEDLNRCIEALNDWARRERVKLSP